ncbi:hypothetical protein BH09BAC1_BH09BAC1_23020 [soil metagenome]
MKKNKLNINPSPLSQEDINAGQNFDSFHQQFQAQHQGPSLLRKLAWPSLAIAAAITIAIFLFRLPDGDVKMLASFVNPPIAGLERGYEAISFVVEKGLNITLPSGTIISVPANAFVDAQGNPYTGEATLKYREYTDPVAIALSGIPMTYDSAGVSYTFESAGMFDLVVEAKPNGNATPVALSLANGTAVSVGMPATTQDTTFNVYELDTTNRNWALRGQDSLAPLPTDTVAAPTTVASTTPTKKKETEVSDPELEKMVKTIASISDSINYYKMLVLTLPVKSSNEAHKFYLDNKVNEFPELILNELLTWEVDAFTPNFDARYTTTRWEKRTVTRGQGSQYNIELIREDVVLNFPVKPVYHGKNFETALKKYKGKLIENEQRLVFLQDKQKEWQERYNAYKASLQASKGGKGNQQELNVQEKQYLDEYNLESTSNTLYRFVAVTNMGIWNIDRVMKDEYVLAETEFKNGKGEVLVMHRLFLFEKGINGTLEFFKMPNNNTVRFKYNPAKGYTGIGITADGHAFLVKPADIKQIKTDGINTITAKELFIPKSEQELREKLKGAV